jgi:lysophospholipase L1-like esterase
MKVNDNNSTEIEDMEKIQTLLRSKKTLTWIFTGDSITHGALHTYGWRSFPEHFSERIRFEMGRGLDYVINTGISGNTANEILQCFERRVSQLKPDVVFLMIGTNDSVAGMKGVNVYESNLSKLVDLIHQSDAIPVIGTPNPILLEVGTDVANRACLPEYVKVMRRVAQQKNIILIDHWKHWETVKPSKDLMMEWLADSMHPNLYGHIEIAKEIFKALGVYDANSPTCKLFVP